MNWEKLAPMPLPRAGCAVAAINDQVLVAGGTFWKEGKKFWCDRFDAFDPAKNSWAPLPPLPRLAGDAAGIARGKDFLVVGGGGSETGAADVLIWDGAGAWRIWSQLPQGRRSTMSAWHDQTLFVIGGLAGGPTQFQTATQTVWSKKTESDWVIRRPMPGAPRFNCAIGSIGRVILVAGGCSPIEGGVRNLDDVLAYDPQADTWEKVGQLPGPSRGGWGVADGPDLLIFGGYSDQFQREVWAWDARTGKARACTALPVGLADARFVRWRDSIIGLSGEDGVQRRYGETIRLARSRL